MLQDYLKELNVENQRIGLTPLFGRTALEDTFNGSVGRKVNDDYGSRNDGEVTYGAHLIVKAIAKGVTQEDFKLGKTAHRKLVHKLKTGFQMTEIGSRWQALESHSKGMDKILNDVL